MFYQNQFGTIGSSTNIIQSSRKSNNWTNSVLIYKNYANIQIYMPCYARMKLKNLVSLDTKTLKGKLNIVILISIYYGQFDGMYPQLFQILQDSLVLRFKIDPTILLKEGLTYFKDKDGNSCSNYITKKIDSKQKIITYSIRKMFTAQLSCQVFWSPFQYIQYIASINMPSIRFPSQNMIVCFNMMNIAQAQPIQTTISYTEEGGLGEYDLAEALVKVQFSNRKFFTGHKAVQNQFNLKKYKKEQARKNLQRNLDMYTETVQQSMVFKLPKVKPFQHGHFIYPVYRQALVSLVNLFFPIVILGFLNLGVFFQNQRAGKRLLNIAAIIVSFVAFLPIIREKLPPSNKLVISQILLFSMASMTLLSLAHTIRIKKMKIPLVEKSVESNYKMIWHQDDLFIATLIMTCAIVLILVYISLMYVCYFYKYFNKQIPNDVVKFDRNNWKNKQCDDYFDGLVQKGLNIKRLESVQIAFKEKEKFI